MNSALQTIIALTLVALVALGFIWRWWQKRHQSGCGGGCGCVSSEIKIRRLAAKERKEEKN